MILTTDPQPAPQSPSLDSVIAYRVNDAATVSGLSRATLYRLIKEGKLRSQIVAGRRLITPAALRELFSEAA
jgi:excisionase family DNA binding protein